MQVMFTKQHCRTPNNHLPIVISVIVVFVVHDCHLAVGNLVSHKRGRHRLASYNRQQRYIPLSTFRYLKIINCIPIREHGRGLLYSRLMDHEYAQKT